MKSEFNSSNEFNIFLGLLRKKEINISVDGNGLIIKSQQKINDEILKELKERKEELINYLTNNTSKGNSSIPTVAIQADYPLSYSQHRLWVLNQLSLENTAYNMNSSYLFEGNLNEEALEKSFINLINRHESLRTVFKENESGEIRQFILSCSELNFSINKIDLQSELNINKILSKEFNIPFKLDEGPLIRASLFKVDTDKWILTYVIHHIIGDGWSLEVIINNLMSFYEADIYIKQEPFQKLTVQYKDYSAWQRSQILSETGNNQKEFWLRLLDGEIPKLELPTDFPRPKVKSYVGDVIEINIDYIVSTEIKSICKEHSVSLFIFLLTALKTLIYRYSNQKDIIIGTPIAGRNHNNLEDQVGFFANTLPLRTQFTGDEFFLDLLAKVKDMTLESFDNSQYPFDKLLEDLNLQRDMSRNPLFDIMLSVQNLEGILDKENFELGNLSISNYNTKNEKNSKFDISIYVAEDKDQISLILEYNTDLFEKSTIDRLGFHFINLMKSIIDDPHQKLYNLNILSSEEKHDLLIGFNETDADFPMNKSLIDLFEEQVLEQPDAVVVVSESSVYSYSQINELSNKLANYLMHSYKIEKGDLISIKLEKSPEMIIAILAILKLGAAYIPIDMNCPQQRLEYILAESQSKVLIDFAEMDCFRQNNLSFSTSSINRFVNEEDLAYVIYTSGSTGNPKGCMLSHKGVVNRLHWMWSEYDFNSNDTILQKTNYSFDVSVWEIFMPLCWGCKMILCPKEAIYSPQKLVETIQFNKVTCLHFVPSVLDSFINSEWEDEYISKKMKTVRCVIASGENLGLSTVKKWYEKMSIPIYNLYGPTEASIDVTHFTTSKDAKKILIGKPIANTEIYILGEYSQVQPIGVIGELCIGGVGLARGYLNQENLTSEKFIENPFKNRSKIYKTGDLARWLLDGNIEYIGRFDDQVKIRGNRIELSEILYEINNLDNVISSAVIVKEMGDGDKHLVAFIVSQFKINEQELKGELLKKLPVYAIPNFFIRLEELPVNKNGKLDKSVLLTYEIENIDRKQIVSPNSVLEEIILDVFHKILDNGNISVTDRFFDIGGTSISVIKLKKELNTKGLMIDIDELFTFSSVRELAIHINSKELIEIKEKVDIVEF